MIPNDKFINLKCDINSEIQDLIHNIINLLIFKMSHRQKAK